MKKIFYVSFLLFFISCGSLKFQENEMDYIQELIGKIKQIEVVRYHYPLKKNDTIVQIDTSILYFGNKNKLLKQIDLNKDYNYETVYNYKNGLLESTLSTTGKSTTMITYKYDKNKNVLEYGQIFNDTLYFLKKSIYDKNNNPLEIIYHRPSNETSNSIDKFNYNYKEKSVIVKSIEQNNIISNNYSKMYYNKKGFMTKSEFIYTGSNNKNSFFSELEYDKRGNLLQRIGYDSYGKIKSIREYKNTYDKKGNIVIREQYYNKKLVEKTTFKITYY